MHPQLRPISSWARGSSAVYFVFFADFFFVFGLSDVAYSSALPRSVSEVGLVLLVGHGGSRTAKLRFHEMHSFCLSPPVVSFCFLALAFLSILLSSQIAFDSRFEGHSDIFVISANGGSPRRLTTEGYDNMMPSWSRDGQVGRKTTFGDAGRA